MECVGLLASVALACIGLSADAGAAVRDAPTPFGPAQVAAALRTSGLTVLPDIAVKLPPGEVMDYGFEGKRSELTLSRVIVYATTERARSASIADRHGFETRRSLTLPSRTLRVRNVLLVFGRPTTTEQWHALATALARLGTPVSP